MGAEQRQRAAERDVWEGILAHLKARLNPHTFATWYKPTRLQAIHGQRLIVCVPNATFQKWLSTDGQAHVNTAMELLELKYAIEYVADENEASTPARTTEAQGKKGEHVRKGPGALALGKLRAIRDSTLPMTRKLLCVSIVLREDCKTGLTFAGVPRLARDCSIGASTAYEHLAGLVKNHVVIASPRPGKTSLLCVSASRLRSLRRQTPPDSGGDPSRCRNTLPDSGETPLQQLEDISLSSISPFDLPKENPAVDQLVAVEPIAWLVQQSIELLRMTRKGSTTGDLDGVKLELRARAAAQGLTCDARMLDDAVEAARDVLVREARH